VAADRVLVDGPALAVARGITPAAVRMAARRGRLQRRGTDERGRALYDLDEALAVFWPEETRRAAG
jgi:hypothetical protein